MNKKLPIKLNYIIIFIIFTLFIRSFMIVNASQNNNSIQDSIPQPILPSVVDKFDPTAKWKEVSDIRPNISFTFKYPPGWDDTSDYCIKPPSHKNLNLSSNCLRILLITDQLPPDDESSIGRDIVLISKAQTMIQGYKAIRKVYSFQDNPEGIPDTYQLWIYEKNHPFALIIGWIGENSNIKTAKFFVKTLDQMVNTLKLHKYD